ncbi:MAG: hypothetical protein P1U53_18845, partial [Sulfitobacter sp.]|nr:hypothetical protein [Sulfitobacter sp.]
MQSIDPNSHHPTGFRVHWPAPATVLLATVAKLSGSAATIASIAARTPWWPPLLGAAMALLAIGLLRDRTDRWGHLAVPLLTGIGGHAIVIAGPGAYDHHVWTSIGLLLGALAVRRRLPWLSGLACFVLFAFTPDAILFATLLLAAQAIAAYRSATPARRAACIAPVIGTIAAILCHRAFTPDDLPITDLDWSRPTVFAPLWIAVFGATACLVPQAKVLAGNATGNEKFTWRKCFGIAAQLILYPGIVLLVTGNLVPILNRFVGSARLFVSEERSPFAQGHLPHPWYLLLLPLVVWACIDLYRRYRDDKDLAVACLTTALLLLACKELRYLKIALPFIAFTVHCGLRSFAARYLSQRQAVAYLAPTVAVLALATHHGLRVRRNHNPLVQQRLQAILDWAKGEYA